MSLRPLGYFDYVKKAFWRKVDVRGLGALPLNPMALAAFAVLGMANPGFWLLGAAYEVAYLALRSSSARFQKLIDGERLLAAQEGWEDRVHAASSATVACSPSAGRSSGSAPRSTRTPSAACGT